MLPQLAAADNWDGKTHGGPGAQPQHERPNPEVMFNRLDKNHDGVITKDEIPPQMPERLKAFLAKTIDESKGKLTKPELLAAVKKHHPAPGPKPRLA